MCHETPQNLKKGDEYIKGNASFFIRFINKQKTLNQLNLYGLDFHPGIALAMPNMSPVFLPPFELLNPDLLP